MLVQLRVLTGFDHLYIGGGNARLLTEQLASDVTTVANEDGITGGARLWALAVAPSG